MRTLVVIPTYNEQQNLPHIIVRVLASTPDDVDVLVVDDASPDGTGDIADQIAHRKPRVHVLHRRGKFGLGPAYLAGFRWGFGRGYSAIVEMDADGSHHPEDLPRLIDGLAVAPIVLGSRWIEGGRVENWPLHRLLLSRGGNWYARTILGIPVRDVTGGFRAYRAETLRKLTAATIASQGYCFQVDLLHRARQAETAILELPIVFTERTIGRSKMSAWIVVESLLRISVWGLARTTHALRARTRPQRSTRRPSPPPPNSPIDDSEPIAEVPTLQR